MPTTQGEMSSPMAFKNSLKATLIELEQPRSRSDEAEAIVDTPPVAERPLENTAKPVTKPRASDEAFLAATWHARAEELCAMADTLPSKDSWSLISKIASLYDELARDAGWSEEAEIAPAPVEMCLENPQPEEAPPADAEPQAIAPPVERTAFRRRPLPGRSIPRRRA